MELLKKLYWVASPSGKEQKMQGFIRTCLNGLGVTFTQDEYGNIYATKGESETYPCIVAHMDEVHRRSKKGFTLIEADGLIFGYNVLGMEQAGIGADDKNGIWVCLKAMEKYDCMKCAFFVEEETGCHGSSHADMAFFDDCRFVLQCDRKGSSDFITNASGVELCSREFMEAIGLEDFGYAEEHGLMTDVMALKENGLNVCAANISCGYYNPHTDSETTRKADLQRCFDLVCHIVENCTDVYAHEYASRIFGACKDDGDSWYLEELDFVMEENPGFNEQDLTDFYNDYSECCAIDYDVLRAEYETIKERQGRKPFSTIRNRYW